MTDKKLKIELPKTTIFIDGSNLFGGLTELLKPGEYQKILPLLNYLPK